MSDDLPTLATAYPGLHPWVDLRDCLVNGWEALGPQTCGVSAQPNMLAWSMRLIGDNSTSRTFMADLPVNLRPPQIDPRVQPRVGGRQGRQVVAHCQLLLRLPCRVG